MFPKAIKIMVFGWVKFKKILSLVHKIHSKWKAGRSAIEKSEGAVEADRALTVKVKANCP